MYKRVHCTARHSPNATKMNEEMEEKGEFFLINLQDFSFGVLAIGMRRGVRGLGVSWICVHDAKFPKNQ